MELDDGTRLEIALEIVSHQALRVGDPLDAELRSVIEDADLRWRAREAALSLLSHRARARQELARRLRKKDFPGAVIRDCLDELEARGFLDDAEFARSFVRGRLRVRPRGRAGLHSELRRLGVDDAVAQTAVDGVFQEESTSDADLALDAARGWLKRQGGAIQAALAGPPFDPDRDKARRRLHGYLARRGFPAGAARAAMATLESEAAGNS
ncbi:MAG TPA: regulatory protein RecX [Longimicrobiales bacterium]